MALTNPQVEKIMRQYDRIRAAARDDQQRRVEEAYRLAPGLRETEQEIADLVYERARLRLYRSGTEAAEGRPAARLAADTESAADIESAADTGLAVNAELAVDTSRSSGVRPTQDSGKTAGIGLTVGEEPVTEDRVLKRKVEELRLRRQELLAAAGLPADQLELRYSCRICKDTGYVDGRKCACFRRAESELFFSEQPIRARLETDSFEHFRLDYYEAERQSEDEESPREHMAGILYDSQRYVKTFKPGEENLLLIGDTGTGKTFLSHCIAGALMDKGFAVVLLSAEELFRILADHVLGRESEEDSAWQLAMDSDLLVIDDLGAEVNNTMVSSQLFSCMERRMLTGKSTLISTNLSLANIRDNYSERVASRILESYTIYHLYNYDSDIRLKVRQERQRRREHE